MSLDVNPLSRLSTATFQLKLIDQQLEQLKNPDYKPAPLALSPIQVAIDTISCLREHLKDISPKAKAIGPIILNKALLELKKIEENSPKLRSSDKIKRALADSLLSCRVAIANARASLEKANPEEAQNSLGFIGRVLAGTAEIITPFFDLTADLGRINNQIADYKESFKKLMKNPDEADVDFKKVNVNADEADADFKKVNANPAAAALGFADTTSQFVVLYLEEELLHITERDASLRPPFLEFFFDNLYTDEPQENPLCTLVKALLQDNKPLMKATIELNLLKGLYQAYSSLKNLESQPFLLDLIRSSLHGAIDSVKKEKAARKEAEVNPLTIEQRNFLLSGTFQKDLVQFILDLGFPKGAEEIELPAQVPTFAKTDHIWPLVQKGLEQLCQSIFSELSTDEDVKNQILIKGYEQTKLLLTTQSQQEATSHGLEQFSRISALAIGIVTVFFNVIFLALRGKKTTGSDSPEQQQLSDDLYEAMKWLAEGSKIRQFFFKRYGKNLAHSAGATLADALKTIKVTDFLNQQLDSMSKDVLNVENIKTLFPRTEEKAQEIKRAQDAAKKANKAHLEELREDFHENINGILGQARDFLYPEGDVKQLSKIHKLAREFFRSCLLFLLRFISKVIKLKQHVSSMERRLYQAARSMDEDQILMTASSESAAKIREAQKAAKIREAQKKAV